MPKLVSEVSNLTGRYSPPEGGQYLQDIGRTHSGSIVIFEGVKYLCTGECYFSDEVVLVAHGKTESSRDKVILPFKDVNSKFPEVGWYNHFGTKKGICTYLDRKTARQWRFGYHRSIAYHRMPYVGTGSTLYSYLYRIASKSSDKKSMYAGENRENTAYNCMYSSYPYTYETALESLNIKESISLALSNRISVALSPFVPDEIGVFLGTSKVAVVNGKGVLNVLEPWAEESILEVCNA